MANNNTMLFYIHDADYFVSAPAELQADPLFIAMSYAKHECGREIADHTLYAAKNIYDYYTIDDIDDTEDFDVIEQEDRHSRKSSREEVKRLEKYMEYIDSRLDNYIATAELQQTKQGEKDHYQDSIKHDNDIDLDREKTRDQLGFKNNPVQAEQPEKRSIADRFKAAKEEAACRNAEKDRHRQEKTKDDRGDR